MSLNRKRTAVFALLLLVVPQLIALLYGFAFYWVHPLFGANLHDAATNAKWLRIATMYVVAAAIYLLFLRPLPARRLAHALVAFALAESCNQLLGYLGDGTFQPFYALLHGAIALGAAGLASVAWPVRTPRDAVVKPVPGASKNPYAPPGG